MWLMGRAWCLSLHGLSSFNDACMIELVKLLAANPQLWSLNLGDRTHLSRESWEKLLAHLRRGRVVGLWLCETTCPKGVGHAGHQWG